MSTVITMPQQGLTEESSVIAEFYVKEGDAVSVGTPLFAIETGKATFDVESEVAGTILGIFASEGDDVPIKSPVCVIGEPGEAFERPAASATPAAAAPADQPGIAGYGTAAGPGPALAAGRRIRPAPGSPAAESIGCPSYRHGPGPAPVPSLRRGRPIKAPETIHMPKG